MRDTGIARPGGPGYPGVARERQQRAALNTETARQKAQQALRLAVNYEPPPF